MNKNPKFSIIVPVYNVEKYLSNCIQSLIGQTLYDIEIICIDDGSTDGSLGILKQYAALDDRMVVIAKKNAGVAAARNAGIERAEGDYILFVDSDDCLEPEACDRLYMEVLQTNADIVKFGTKIFPINTDVDVSWVYDAVSVRQVNYHKHSLDALFDERSSKPFIWNGCYKSTLFKKNGLKFDEDMIFAEDMLFLFDAFPMAKEISYIPDLLYNYRAERKDSHMGKASKQVERKLDWHIIVIKKVFLKWKKENYLRKYKSKLASWALNYFYWNLISDDLDIESRARLSKEFVDIMEEYDVSLRTFVEKYNKRNYKDLIKMSRI